MTEADQIRQQQLTIMSQQVRLAQQEAKIAKLEHMHRAEQSHIQTLQRVINEAKKSDADTVFR